MHRNRDTPLVVSSKKNLVAAVLPTKDKTVLFKHGAHLARGYALHTLMGRNFYFNRTQERIFARRDIFAVGYHVLQI